MSYYSRGHDEDENSSLSAMMTQTVSASTMRSPRAEMLEGATRSDSRPRSSSVVRRMSDIMPKKDTPPLTPRRGRSFDEPDLFDTSEGHNTESRPRSTSIIRRLVESRKNGVYDDEVSVGTAKTMTSKQSKAEAKTSKKKSKKLRQRSRSRECTKFDDEQSVSSKLSRRKGDKKKLKQRSRSTERIDNFDEVQTNSSKVSKRKSEKKKTKQRSKSTERIRDADDVQSVSSKVSKKKDDKKKTKRRSKSMERPIDHKKSDHDKPNKISRAASSDGHDSLLSHQSSHHGSVYSMSPRKEKRRKPALPLHPSSLSVKSIIEPALPSEGTVIKDEMEQFFPSPEVPKKSFSSSQRRTRLIANPLAAISDDKSMHGPSVHSITLTSEIASPNSGPTSIRIMSNKAAEEHAEAVLNRLAAHKEKSAASPDSSHDKGFNDSEATIGAGVGRQRRSSLNNPGSRWNEQYLRLQRDSGINSVTSFASALDVDDDASYQSRSSWRSMGSKSIGSRVSRGGSSAGRGSSTGLPGRHKWLEFNNKDTGGSQKQLSDALAQIAELNTNLKREEKRSETAESDLLGLKSKLERIENERSFLIGSVRDMEEAFAKKDERVEKLEKLVKTHLTTVEDLEDKLGKTENELTEMEDELDALLAVVEDKNHINDGTNSFTKREGRRIGSVREDALKRKDSLKMQREQSRRVLLDRSSDENDLSGSNWLSENRSRLMSLVSSTSENQSEAEELHNQLKARELKLNADREECDAREKGLDTREQDLLAFEDQLKRERNHIQDERMKLNDAEPDSWDASTSALKEENSHLRKAQIEDASKIKRMELENEDLRSKLDGVTKMISIGEPSTQSSGNDDDLSNVLELVAEKNELIKSLQKEVDKLRGNGDLSNVGGLVHAKNQVITGLEDELAKLTTQISQDSSRGDEEGKDLLIQELQNQLVIAKKETSGGYVNRLKNEIKTLKGNIRHLKNRMKQEDYISKSVIKKKDDAYILLGKQMEKLKFELERRDKRDKNLGSDEIHSNSDLKHHIEDLEDEISHWKSTNADLENEVENLKAIVDEVKGNLQSNDRDENDDSSAASFEVSISASQHDGYFVSNSIPTASLSNSSRHDMLSPGTNAIKKVTNLWSKMRHGPESPSPHQPFPYAAGSLNEE